MRKFYSKLEKLIENDLNEYIKWVIMLGLYLFYRMMEKAYEESELTFLVIPIFVLAVLVFISDWIIRDMILSVSPESEDKSRPKAISIIISSFLYLSILLFILFYITQYAPLINAGFFSLLLAPILSRYQDVTTIGQENAWFRWGALILIFIGIGGLLMAFLYNNYLNVVTFIFYIACMIYYFLNLYLFRKKITD